MNQAEIMTLRGAKVNESTIRSAIIAGKMQAIVQAAERQIMQAGDFNDNAQWTEMLRVMEGTLEKQPKGYKSDKHQRSTGI